MPSVTALSGETVSLDQLKPFWSMTTWLDVQSGNDRLSCKDSNNCRVLYSWWYTPIWYYLSPPIMYHGQDVNLYMDPKNAPDYKRADQMAADIRLGGIRFLNTDYTVGYNMGKNNLQGLRGVVRSKHRTNNVELDIWFRGAGYALQNKESSTTCNWDRTDCYYGRIYPSIDTISANSGSDFGAQELVITGNSFDKATSVEVLVDDVPCDISDVTVDTITCTTGPKTIGAPQASYAGEHGLYRTLVNANGGANASNYDTLTSERILLT